MPSTIGNTDEFTMQSVVKFADILNDTLNRQDRNSAWLADRLDISRSTVSRWANNETRPRSPAIVSRIADVLNLYSAEERGKLFGAYTGFGAAVGQSDSAEIVAADAPIAVIAPSAEEYNPIPIIPSAPLASPGLNVVSLWRMAYIWWYSLVRWEDAPEHILDNWEGKVLFVMGNLTQRLSTGPFLALLTAIGLWISTSWLLTPFLRWPLESTDVRWQASISFAVATIFIPLCLAAIVSPLDYDDFKPGTYRERMRIFVLKLAGASTGFAVFAAILLLPVLAWHYFVGTSFSVALCWILSLPPLLFGYVAARRTPADRFRMFKGHLRLHEADPLFLVVSGLLGPVLAALIYFGYPMLENGYFGFLLLLVAIGLLVWEHRKAHPDFLSDKALILLVGLLLPIGLFITLSVMPDARISPFYDLAPQFLLLSALYFLSETVLIVTLVTRNPPTLTLHGMLSLLAVSLAALFVQHWSLLAGRVFVLLLLALWIGWGRNRFRHRHAVHPSFALLQTGLILSILAVAGNVLPLWLNALLFLFVAVSAIGWAYRAKP